MFKRLLGGTLGLVLAGYVWAQHSGGAPTHGSTTSGHAGVVSHATACIACGGSCARGSCARAAAADPRCAAMVQSLEKNCGGLTADQRLRATVIYDQYLKDCTAIQANRRSTARQKEAQLQACQIACRSAVNSCLTPAQVTRCQAAGATPHGTTSHGAPATTPHR